MLCVIRCRYIIQEIQTLTSTQIVKTFSCAHAIKVLYFIVRKAAKRKVQKMNNSIEIYITSDYSVILCDNDINSITESVREILYSMPRPDDYTVADVITKAGMIVRMYIENIMEQEAEEEYSYADLDNKQRTKLDYQYVTKKVLEQIEVIAK